jgi:hypothetical protein
VLLRNVCCVVVEHKIRTNALPKELYYSLYEFLEAFDASIRSCHEERFLQAISKGPKQCHSRETPP